MTLKSHTVNENFILEIRLENGNYYIVIIQDNNESYSSAKESFVEAVVDYNEIIKFME